MNKRRVRELADHIEALPHYLRRDPEVTDAFGPDYTGPAPDLFSMACWHSGVYVLGDGRYPSARDAWAAAGAAHRAEGAAE